MSSNNKVDEAIEAEQSRESVRNHIAELTADVIVADVVIAFDVSAPGLVPGGLCAVHTRVHLNSEQIPPKQLAHILREMAEELDP